MDSLLSNDMLVDNVEEDDMTACDVLRNIEELWITEKMSPTLEPHRKELVDCMLDQLTQMSENLKKCKKIDFRLAIHKLEIDRIRYIISSYLRTRLQKIEAYPQYLLKIDAEIVDENSAIMSPEERQYAEEYASNLDQHLNSLGTQHMPSKLRSIDNITADVKPNLDSYVFFRVKKPVRGLLIEDNTGEGRDEEIDLNSQEQHLMKFSTVKHLLQDSSINLI